MSRRTGSRRLTERTQFQDVLGRGRAVKGRYFIISALAGTQSCRARLGIVTARKRIRRAVDRNTCKRVVRESFREHEADLAGLDIVVACRTALWGTARRSARQELDRLFAAFAGQAGE